MTPLPPERRRDLSVVVAALLVAWSTACTPSLDTGATPASPADGAGGGEDDAGSDDAVAGGGGPCAGGVECGSDFDHDGVPDADDTCPTVWNPDNDGALCPGALGAGHAGSLQIVLSEAGHASTWRRTHEPFDLPLVNGLLDASVAGYWPLDGDGADVMGGAAAEAETFVPAQGAFGDLDGALELLADDTTRLAVTHSSMIDVATGDFSISLWVVPGPAADTTLVAKQPAVDGAPGWQLDLGAEGVVAFVCRDQAGADGSVVTPAGAVQADVWTHIAAVRSAGWATLWVDGRLAAGGPVPAGTLANEADLELGRRGPGERVFVGTLDEVVLWRRGLAPDEIAAYHQSRAPYGTSLAPGAQDDFDDVRVTELSSLHEGYAVPREMIGVREHSDTPCPAGPAGEVALADRDDLCGVLAYWRLDGDTGDVTGTFVANSYGTVPGEGRFGDAAGAMHFAGDDHIETFSQFGLGAGDSFTVELWVRTEVHDGIVYGCEAQHGGRSYMHLTGGDTPIVLYAQSQHDNDTDMAKAPGNLADGTWHHLAAVRNVDRGVLQVYVDGLLGAETTTANGGGLNPGGCDPAIGARQTGEWQQEQNFFDGDIDEVIVHGVAKSADYIYRRAHPGVPTVRWLAHTESTPNVDGGFDFLGYTLHYGHPTAEGTPPLLTDRHGCEHHGLLSPALGYVGWWQLDDAWGPRALDSATGRLHGVLDGAAIFAPGLDGTAVAFDGVDDHIAIAHDERLSASDVTVEVLAATGGDAPGVLVTKGSPADGAGYNYRLDASEQGALAFGCTDATAAPHVVGGDAPLNQWAHLAGRLADRNLTLFVDHTPVDQLTDIPIATLCDAALILGGDPGLDFDAFLAGSIDMVRISSRPLEADELLHFPRVSRVAPDDPM